MSSDSEESIYYISDQDSTDENPEIEIIIQEKLRIYPNQPYAIKILLGEHFQKFRKIFFKTYQNSNYSYYKGVQKELKNNLYPYNSLITKNSYIMEEIKHLYKLLKNYYKEKYFNKTYLINYLDDLKILNNSKFLYQTPRNEIETLNDIERKMEIIRHLQHHLNTSIIDRIQKDYFEENIKYNDKIYTKIMYEYLVIKDEIYKRMSLNELREKLSNSKNSFKLRRPIGGFNFFTYIPIICKGYCLKEAEIFIEELKKSILGHLNKEECDFCKEIFDNYDNISEQIKCLYIKTCIFAHNINEIIFHPLMFLTFNNYYPKETNKKNEYPPDISNILKMSTIPKEFLCKKKYIRQIFNGSEKDKLEILNNLSKYAKNRNLFGNKCFLSQYKTQPCLILKENFIDISNHISKCPYYHNVLEKRRIKKTPLNRICNKVIENKKWKINNNCKLNEDCDKFITRNELFFDERNYRKLYPCTSNIYCEKGALCPRKHATDIKVNEIYLPENKKKLLKKDLNNLINKEKTIQKNIRTFKKVTCIVCFEYQELNFFYIFQKCTHVLCQKCFDIYKMCPACPFDENNIELKVSLCIDYNLNEQNKTLSSISESSSSELSDSVSESNDIIDVEDII